KQEVAGGLLSRPVGDKEVKPVEEHSCILGEDQVRADDGTTVLNFFRRMNAAEMSKVKIPADLSSAMIAVFLGTVVTQNWKGLNLDEALLANLRLPAVDVEQRVRRSAMQGGVLQPVFFSELKVAMDHYMKKVASARAAGAR
ncbi:MAG: hypothetical protein AAB654_19090, partial [Acidobacteriota bacterium]